MKPIKAPENPCRRSFGEQVPLIKEMLSAMGINIMSLEGYEADDLLGTVARRSEAKGMDVTILSETVIFFSLPQIRC